MRRMKNGYNCAKNFNMVIFSGYTKKMYLLKWKKIPPRLDGFYVREIPHHLDLIVQTVSTFILKSIRKYR